MTMARPVHFEINCPHSDYYGTRHPEPCVGPAVACAQSCRIVASLRYSKRTRDRQKVTCRACKRMRIWRTGDTRRPYQTRAGRALARLRG